MILRLSGLFSIVLLSLVPQTSAADITVQGYVYGNANKPLDNAIVVIFPVGAQGGQVKFITKADGHYSLTIKQGTVFDIGYGHPSVGMVTFNRLNADKDHFISKIVFTDLKTASSTAVFD